MVDRYDFETEYCGLDDASYSIPIKKESGQYVLYDDYVKVEAENKALNESKEILTNHLILEFIKEAQCHGATNEKAKSYADGKIELILSNEDKNSI